MGIPYPSCSCVKNSAEEKKSEFKPELLDLKKSEKNNLLKNNKIDDNYLTSPRITEENNSLKLMKNTTFSFRQIVKTKTIDPDKILKIQKVIRAFLFRKKFNELKGLKEKLKKDSEEFIKKKRSEYIKESLMEVDEIIKKNFNDNFLSKLQLKKNTTTKANYSIRTECLIKKNKEGKEEGFLYKGELDKNGKINGYGELYLKDGKKYEGKFIDGKLNGYGRVITLFGLKCFEGNFKDNEFQDGQGRIIEIEEDGSKTVYDGNIENMKREGKGIEDRKKYTYMGSFKDDLKHGKGKIIFHEDDSYYEGDFNKGQMTGYGIFHYKDKSCYDGEFLDGKMHGHGIFKWPDKSEFEGNYNMNLKEGYGEYRWKSGKKYQGNHKDGKRHGKGVYIYPNGERKEVEFYEGNEIKKYHVSESLLKDGVKREFTLE